MKALRICLDCPARTRRPRCPRCEAKWQQRRNQSPARAKYAGTWRAESKAARKGVALCSKCGVPFDPTDPRRRSTLDHLTNLVLCQSCNSGLRRNPA